MDGWMDGWKTEKIHGGYLLPFFVPFGTWNVSWWREFGILEKGVRM